MAVDRTQGGGRKQLRFSISLVEVEAHAPLAPLIAHPLSPAGAILIVPENEQGGLQELDQPDSRQSGAVVVAFATCWLI
jgi:hypothetical protein